MDDPTFGELREWHTSFVGEAAELVNHVEVGPEPVTAKVAGVWQPEAPTPTMLGSEAALKLATNSASRCPPAEMLATRADNARRRRDGLIYEQPYFNSRARCVLLPGAARSERRAARRVPDGSRLVRGANDGPVDSHSRHSHLDKEDAVKHSILAKSGLEGSAIAFGSWQLGGERGLTDTAMATAAVRWAEDRA